MAADKEITIYDIAKKLSVSPATISRGLQDHSGIIKKTRKKIFDTADELGYRTNHFARNLRQQQTMTIGIIVPRLNSNFITLMLSGIEKVTAEEGYDLIMTHSSENSIKEAANARNLFSKRVNGLIASLSFDTTNLDHFKPFTDKGVPVLFFDTVEQDGNNTVVIIDNSKSGYLATKHLIDQGCRRIAHITTSLNRNVYSQRYKGYQDALFDNNLPVENELVIVGELNEESAMESARKLLSIKPLPDGVFVTSDFVAAVCIRAFKEAGIRVPDDIAVVGFNNDALGKLIEPTLTAINYPGKDVGEVGARHLINHIKGISKLQQTNTIIIRSELIVRNSSLRKPTQPA